MAKSGTLIIFIFILVIFNFLAGTMGTIESSEDSNRGRDFSIKKLMPITNIHSDLQDKQKDYEEESRGFLSGLTSLTIFIITPFILLDVLIMVVGLLSYGFSVVPPIFNIIILTPMTIIIMIDYVIPMIRGN